MAGISRVFITDPIRGRGAWRFTDSRLCYPEANKVYRDIFDRLKSPLEEGDAEIKCTKEEFQAGYDYELGIDVILKFIGGQSATLQEKFLFTTFNTVTVEYYQDWRRSIPGDWFNMKCQYYFVGYDEKKRGKFDDWLLLDWARVMLATNQDRIKWKEKPNNEDGARANFRYVHFRDVPQDVIIAKPEPKPPLQSTIHWPEFPTDDHPTWPLETYQDWLKRKVGTPEQLIRYQQAVDWYKAHQTLSRA